MVYRIYVEKRPGLDNEARSLLNDARTLLGVNSLENVRLLNRYDCEGDRYNREGNRYDCKGNHDCKNNGDQCHDHNSSDNYGTGNRILYRQRDRHNLHAGKRRSNRCALAGKPL